METKKTLEFPLNFLKGKVFLFGRIFLVMRVLYEDCTKERKKGQKETNNQVNFADAI